jgi:hypothetical protein
LTRSRAQASRDAALRRLTRVNHGLTAAAAIGAGVLTEVIAHTASAHTRTISSTARTLAPVSSGSAAQRGAGAEGDDRLTTSSAPAAVTTRHRSAAVKAATATHASTQQAAASATQQAAASATQQTTASSTQPTTASSTQQTAASTAQQQAPAQATQSTPVVVSGGS